MVLLLSFAFVLGVKPPTVLKFSEYQGMHSLSEDSMQVFALTPFSSLGEPLKAELAAAANLTSEEMNKSILDIVGILWGINRTDYAANLTREYFWNILGNSTNYSLIIYEYGNNYIIYNSSSISNKRRVISSTSRVVSGYKENNPRAGFVARAFIASATKRMQSYAYFGGFEGSGNITKILILPESVSAISEAYMEMDVASNFTLYINGKYSGAYNISARKPLYAKNWTVPQSYYGYFVNGSNNITVAFSGISSGYVGGGFIRVRYNTTILDTSGARLNPDGNATERYYFPGIDGLINIYSSFYVPGVLKSLGIQLHYMSNYTVYLIIGNVSVYENSTGTPKTIYLNNTFLSSVLNYSFFNQTMPVRFGTRNITGMGEGSDAVLITDVSGSMTTCDVDASGGDCNGGIPGVQNRRIDIAKESDAEFVRVILANAGQKVGLISYDSTTKTAQTVNLTDNNNTLISMINTYAAGTTTCIACGIKSATDMLAATVSVANIIANRSQWHYNDSYLSGELPLDSEGRNWTSINYSLGALWKSGNAVFGNGSYSIPAATNIAGSAKTYANLSNITSGAKYDYDNTTVVYSATGNKKLNFSTRSGNPLQNRCLNGGSNYDCSGGFIIMVNITPLQYAILSSGGVAYVSFDYWWNATNSASFESSDEVWIKARWVSPASGAHSLGSQLSSAGSDTTPEIASGSNPYYNFSGHALLNITAWIEGAGTYYLDFGGKLYASASDENGNFSFDNVLLEISNITDAVYFRKNFTIANISSVGKSILKVLSDDSAEIYINGAQVFNDTASAHGAAYWNAVNVISRRYFRQGENIIAARLRNKAGPSRFDLELLAVNDSRNKAMLVMSDGQANVQLTPFVSPLTSAPILAGGSFSTADSDAINRSCFAYENYGIISHSVGFGSGADAATLGAIASCGRGSFYTSNNEDELKKIYRDIANSIISYSTQAAEISGETSPATLYTDSFIEYNYTPAVDPRYGNISLALESNTFGNTSGNYSVESPKNGSYNVSSNMLVTDAKVTSYSSDFWTSSLEVNSTTGSWKTAFSLNTFGTNYMSLGDPFIVNIPVSLIKPGEMNYVRINTAKNSTELEGGSPDNRVIYSVRVKGSVDYGVTFNTSDDAKADAKKRLSDYLASFGISADGIDTGSQDIGKIPWMWGPAVMTFEVWK